MSNQNRFWQVCVAFILAAIVATSGLGPLLEVGVRPAQARGQAQLEAIVFSQEATVAHQPILLTMRSQVGGTIHYTTNGSVPSATTTPYTGPIPINESTVIRAQVFQADGTPLGGMYTKSYIIAAYDQTIPVISISAEWQAFQTRITRR